MKAYGVPRVPDLECPDIADIKLFGLKSAIGTLRQKGGDFKGYFKNKKAKAEARRVWKKKERQKQKEECRRALARVSTRGDGSFACDLQ